MTGEPTYVELGVRDADAARAFYGRLLGWRPTGSNGPGNVSTSTLHIGIHDHDPAAQMLIFFGVDDLDASMARVAELGGAVYGDPVSDPGFGRFAICTDDQGVRFALHERPA